MHHTAPVSQVAASATTSTATRRSKSRAIALVFALVAASSALSAEPAAAYSCYGDPWADGVSWADNQWWGDGCSDKQGDMVLAIQRIVNYTITGQGCWAGAEDGEWGPQTKSGVMCYQDWKGLDDDGIVGSDTWGQRARSPYTGLMSEIDFYGQANGVLWYDTDWRDYEFYMVISTGYWWVRNICDEGSNYSKMNNELDTDCED